MVLLIHNSMDCVQLFDTTYHIQSAGTEFLIEDIGSCLFPFDPTPKKKIITNGREFGLK